MKKLFVLIFLSILLIACNNIVTLEKPTNLHLEDRILKWDEVTNASGYYIVINDKISSTSNSFFDLSSYKDGNYNVKVKAFGEGYKDSNYSDLFLFTLSTLLIPLNPPVNLKIENKVLSWNQVENASGYYIDINGVMSQTTTNFYDFSSYQFGNYNVKVKAFAQGYEESVYSEVFSFTLSTPLIPLDPPVNLKIENKVLSWDQVESTSGYYIDINGVISQTNDNFYDFTSYQDGNYDVKVKAYADGYEESDYSEVFSFTLSTPLIPLNPPVNLIIENKVLSWDQVDNATRYYIDINGVLSQTNDNFYDLTSYQDGDYDVKVKASADGYEESDYSELFSFVLTTPIYPLDPPSNLKIENGVLLWDEVEDVKHYLVKINNSFIQTVNNEYSLLHLQTDRVFNIGVKVVLNDDRESDFSEVITHSTHYAVVDSKKQIFLKSSASNLVFDLSDFVVLTIKNADDEIITEGVSVVNNIVTFSNDYLKSLTYQTYTFSIITTTGKAIIEIEITDDRKPYMISSNNITFDNQDIILLFELYDGQFVSLNGNNITAADYVIEGNQVTLNKAFVENVFSDPNRTAPLILGYHLTANTNEVIGFIFINRNI